MSSLPIGIYVRVSRKGDREDERFHSPREQVERATALILGRGYEPGPVYEDIDVSGATHPRERPAMARLLDDVEAGRIGGAAAFALDRFSREPSHGDELVQEVTKAGGVILAPDIPEAIDSPTGEFTFGMLLQVAKLYRSQAGARFASAKEHAILQGVPVGPTPFGYRQRVPRPDGKDTRTLEERRIEVDPKDAPVVRDMYERRARGEGPSSLADSLTSHTRHVWSREGVRALIRRRLYATGRLQYGDVVSEWDAGAIVDEPLWHAAQTPTSRPRKARGKKHLWLLTGLLKCAACLHNLKPHTTARGANSKVYRRYHCRNRKCTARASVQAPRIEGWVVRQSFIAGDAMLSREQEAPDLGPLEELVATTERRLEQVLAPEARDALGDLWVADVRERRGEHEAALTALGEARQVAGTPAVEFRLRDVWDTLSHEDRRAALQLFWREIRVGRPGEGGLPVTLVARGPGAEVEVDLPPDGGSADP